ncbi:MAG: hypothetical protein AAF573_03755 [Bacteroidota bacterium]
MKTVNFIFKILKLTCIIIVTIFASSQKSVAQDMSAFVNVFPPYPLELEHYIENFESLHLELQNNTQEQKEVYLGIRVRSDYGLEVRSNATYRPSDPFLIKKNSSIIFDSDDFEAVYGDLSYPSDFTISGASDKISNLIQIQRILPEGSYQVCIMVYDWNTDQLLTGDCSQWFSVEVGDVPMIISPQNQETLEEEAITLFSWDAPLNVALEYELEYGFKIINLTEYGVDGFDVESLFADPAVSPVFEMEGLTETFYNYESGGDDPLLEGNQTYAMRVTAKEANGELQFQNNGHSEIVIFKVEAADDIVEEPFDIVGHFPNRRIYVNKTDNIMKWSFRSTVNEEEFRGKATFYDVTETVNGLLYLSEEEKLSELATNHFAFFSTAGTTGADSLFFDTEDADWVSGNIYAVTVRVDNDELEANDVLFFELYGNRKATEDSEQVYEMDLDLVANNDTFYISKENSKVAWNILPEPEWDDVACTFNIYDVTAFDTTELKSLSLFELKSNLTALTSLTTETDYNFKSKTFSTIGEEWVESNIYGVHTQCISAAHDFTIDEFLWMEAFSDPKQKALGNAVVKITAPENHYDEYWDEGKDINIAWALTTEETYPNDSIKYQIQLVDLEATGFSDTQIENMSNQKWSKHLNTINNDEDKNLAVVLATSVGSSLTYNLSTDSLEVGTYYALVLNIENHPDELSFDETTIFRIFEYREEPTECEENCYYAQNISTTPASNASAFSTLKIGNFEIKDITTDYVSGEEITGEGTIEVDFLMGAKIKVEFSRIQVNTDGRVYSGTVKAKENSTGFNLVDLNASVEASTTVDASTTEGIYDYLLYENNLAEMAMGQKVSMPLGFESSFKGHQIVLGFTEMNFTADQATSNMIASLYLPTMGDNNFIALGASDICMNPGGFASEYVLHLADTLVIQNDGDWKFQLAGGLDSKESTKSNGTYVAIDCEGIKEFAIRGAVDLPKKIVVPEDTEGNIIEDDFVTAAFQFKLDRGDNADSTKVASQGMHWWASVDFEDFQIKGLTGWGFEIEEAYLDMSDIANPDDITFPASYSSSEKDDTWQGFYIKRANIKTPPAFAKDGIRQSASINNLMIDSDVSATIALTNLIETNEGKIDACLFSIDSLFLTIDQGSFANGGMHGRLGLPFMADPDEEDAEETSEYEDYLTYTALISKVAEDSTMRYDFAIEHEGKVKLPMYLAEAEFNQSSYVKANWTPAEKKFGLEAFVKGKLTIDTKKLNSLSEKLPADLNLPGVKFQMKYKDKAFSNCSVSMSSNDEETDTRTSYVPAHEDMLWASTDDEMIWSELTSDSEDGRQNVLSGFPISITEMDLTSNGSGITFSVTPELALQGGEAGFSIATKVNLNSALQTNAEGIDRIKFTGFQIECVKLDVDADNVVMEGELCFYNDQNEEGVGDRGVKGSVNALVPGVQIGVNLAAEFGTRVVDKDADYGTVDNYGYWFVDGLFYMGTVGVPIPPGYVSVHGMGGSISVNMKKTSTAALAADAIRETREMTEEEATGGDPNDVEVTTTTIEREPHFGARGLGFTVIMAAARPELVNMDLGIEATWQKGEGLQTISVLGDGYFFTPLMSRNNPQLRAKCVYTIHLLGDGDVAFTGTNDVYMNFITIKGGFENNLLVEGAGFHVQNFGGEDGNGYWDIQLGTYDSPGKVKFYDLIEGHDDLELDIAGSAYLMAGHNVPTTAPPYPQKILDLLNTNLNAEDGNEVEGEEAEENEAARNINDIEANKTGSGIAIGKQFEAIFKFDKGAIFADLNATVGMDFNITQDEARVCYVPKTGEMQTAGINGWYGNGQAYAGLEGDLGVNVKLFGKEQKIKILYLAIVGGLQGGGPTPFWAEGRFNVMCNLMNGTLKGSYRWPVTFGSKCTPSYDDPLADIPMIAETYPANGDKDISPYTDPMVTFNVPMEEVIYIPTINEYEETIVEQYKPYLEDFYVDQKGAGKIEHDKEYWENENTEYRIRYGFPLQPKSGRIAPTFDLHTIIKAKRWNYNEAIWNDLYVEGELWSERDTASFETGEHPDHFDDDLVKKAVPLNRQRYFMQDEVMNDQGNIDFTWDMDKFFPEKDQAGTYQYYLRFKALDQEDIDINITTQVAGQSNVRKITFDMPELKNSTMYALQVVQKNIQKQSASNSSATNFVASYTSENEEQDTYSNYQIISQASAINESKKVGNNEHLVYVYYFQTSAYNTLSEKLAGATLESVDGNLYLQTEEAFDEFDIFGATDADGKAIMPRMFLTDPFESDYHTKVASKLLREPLIDYYDVMQGGNPVIYGNYSYSLLGTIMDILNETLNFDWTANNISFTLNGNVYDGYDEALRTQELNRTWSGLNTVFGGDGDGMQTLNGMLPDDWDFNMGSTNGTEHATLAGLAIKYDIHQRAEDDAEVIEEWATEMIDTYVPAITQPFVVAGGHHFQTYFENNYTAFLDWHAELLNRQLVLLKKNIQVNSASAGIPSSNSNASKGANNASTEYQLNISSERGFSNYRLETGSEEAFNFKMY